jgi:hypothetical protein
LRRAAVVILACLSAAPAAAGDAPEVHGYVKLQSTLRLFHDDDLGSTVAGSHPTDGKLDLRLDIAWRSARWDVVVDPELVAADGDSVRASRDPATGPFAALLLGVPQPGDQHQWLDLDRTFSSGGSHLVFGRFDRLSVGYTGDRFVMRLGRQALSWGGGLVFQVLDLFNPFPPTVIDTDYKPGTDMVTTQWLLPGGDDLQAILVPRRPSPGSALTADASSLAIKWHHVASGSEVELMAARHYGDSIAGGGVTGNLGGGVWRLNVTTTALSEGGLITSLLANLDHSWVWGARNVYGFAEYFRNGFGVASLDRSVLTLPTALLDRVERGELFNLGRDELAAGLQVEWTPRLTFEPTAICDLNDFSSMLLVRAGFDWLQSLRLDAGLQTTVGRRGTEYGGVKVATANEFLTPGRLFWVRLSRYF